MEPDSILKNKKFSIIPPSAEDFVGLLYRTLGKGKIGNAQMAWYKSTLLDPYARAMNDISRFQQSLQADFRALKKELIESGNIPKNLRKEAIDGFTFEDAVRILAWDKQGINIDGLSKRDLQMIKNKRDVQIHFSGTTIRSGLLAACMSLRS